MALRPLLSEQRFPLFRARGFAAVERDHAGPFLRPFHKSRTQQRGLELLLVQSREPARFPPLSDPTRDILRRAFFWELKRRLLRNQFAVQYSSRRYGIYRNAQALVDRDKLHIFI